MPEPSESWVMHQRWHDLLFAHWPIAPDVLRGLIPSPLTIDTYDGMAWVAVVPFYMSGVRFRGVPAIPTTEAFAELNVRTYVTYDGRPGVWFFSMDAASTLAVIGARLGAHLPYFRAAMTIAREGSRIRYASRRWRGQGGAASLAVDYEPVSAPVPATPDSLEWFLVERYSLYAAAGRRLWRGDLHHSRWQLSEATATFAENTMLGAAGIAMPLTAPRLHFAVEQDVRFWPLRRVN